MAKEKRFYVYVLFRPWDGTPFYVGKGTGRRAHKHFHGRSLHFRNIVERAGGTVPVVIVREDMTEVEAFVVECALIKAIGRGESGPLVNFTDGGEGATGAVRSIEARAKLSAAAMGNTRSKGYKHTAEALIKLSAANSNRSPETRAKLRAANLGKQLDAEHREKLRLAKLGKKQPPEVVAKRAASNTGKKRTAATRNNISAALIGHPGLRTMLGKSHSAATRAKIREAAIAREATKRADKLHPRQPDPA